MLLLILALTTLGSISLFSADFGIPVGEVCMAGDGSSFAVRTLENQVHLYSYEGEKVFSTSHERGVTSLALSGGPILVVGDSSGKLKLYQGAEEVLLVEERYPISSVDLSRGGEKIVYSSNRELGIISHDHGAKVELEDYIYSVAVAGDGSTIAAGLSNGKLLLLNSSGELIGTIDLGRVIYDVETSSSHIMARTTDRVVVLSREGDTLFEGKLSSVDAALAGEAGEVAIAVKGGVEVYNFSSDFLYSMPAKNVQSVDVPDNGSSLLLATAGRVKLIDTQASSLPGYVNVSHEKTGRNIENATKILSDQKNYSEKSIAFAFLAGFVISTLALLYFRVLR